MPYPNLVVRILLSQGEEVLLNACAPQKVERVSKVVPDTAQLVEGASRAKQGVHRLLEDLVGVL